jgi:hypothetical protein
MFGDAARLDDGRLVARLPIMRPRRGGGPAPSRRCQAAGRATLISRVRNRVDTCLWHRGLADRGLGSVVAAAFKAPVVGAVVLLPPADREDGVAAGCVLILRPQRPTCFSGDEHRLEHRRRRSGRRPDASLQQACTGRFEEGVKRISHFIAKTNSAILLKSIDLIESQRTISKDDERNLEKPRASCSTRRTLACGSAVACDPSRARTGLVPVLARLGVGPLPQRARQARTRPVSSIV